MKFDTGRRGERCAIAAQAHIETLNELFGALFRTEEGTRPVIREPQRPVREALFALFFPQALVAQYADKSKSNLTWFFNSDPRNKSVRRSLVTLLEASPRPVIDEVHRRCRDALWPRLGEAVFDAPALRQVLGSVRVDGGLNAKWRILPDGAAGEPCKLDLFFEADPSAALARMLLTLAVAGDAPTEVVGELWRAGTGGVCEFLRGDETVEGRIRYSRMLDLEGHQALAYDGYEKVARQLNRPAQTPAESAMYGRMGEMLHLGEGHFRDERAALECYRLGCLDANPRSWYLYAKRALGADAREAMERATELGYAPAIRELGDAWFNGSARLGCARNLESAKRCYQKGLALPDEDGAYCACMLGRVYETQGERGAAVSAYRVAQEGGSAEAAQRLARLDWTQPEAAPRAGSDGPKYCLTNAFTGCNPAFVAGLQGRWEISVCDREGGALPSDGRVRRKGVAPEQALRELAKTAYWGGVPEFPPLVIAMLSADREQNLYQAIAVLGELQQLALSLGERAWDLVDCVWLYVLAEHDYAALLLDAAFAGMQKLYFRVRVCDPALDAADQLFAAAPLFLPRLRDRADAPVALRILGDGDAALALLRRAVTLPMPEPVDIRVDGAPAQALRRRYEALCPGLCAAPLPVAEPEFTDCEMDALPGLAREGALAGNYFVVAGEDDAANLRLAARLRMELLRRSPGFDALPFIAVLVRDPVAGWLAGSLPAGGDAAPAKWFGQFDLFPFGALSMYALRALEQEPLERRARQAHMLFLGLPNTRDARHAAMGSYYRCQLNRDTARAAAASLIYRMHLAGVSLPGWKLYGAPEEEARLGPAYTRWLREGDHLPDAVRAEHERRCRALLADGWESATPEQVAAYVRRGNPGWRLYPAKLDPFICPWDALDERLPQVRDAVRAVFPERTVHDPRRAEEESVRDTERLLAVSE